MRIVYCNEHNVNIVIYDYGEENKFIDDNRRQVVIFTKKDGVRYLKRFLLDNCKIVQSILNEKNYNKLISDKNVDIQKR